MNRPSARNRLVPVRLAGLAVALLLVPSPLRAGGGADGHVPGIFDLGLVLATTLAVGLVFLLLHRSKQKSQFRQAEDRLRQLTALIEHADCLLWEAEVEVTPDDWLWRMKLHDSAFCRKLFRGQPQVPGVDLWVQFTIEDREALNRRARAAMEAGLPGYEQEFRAVREGQVCWMHENVSISRLDGRRYWLVGLATDITAQREAEEARRRSEVEMDRILANAQCLLWRATVIYENGVMQWPHFDIPQSQLSEALFGNRVFSPARGFWDTLQMPAQRAMDERSSQAILGGQPGYAQQFLAINEAGRHFWLNEQVSITQVAANRWSLVGVVTDITAQRAAEEARQRSERQLAHLLERADTMLWQAKVERQAGGALLWTMFVPKSQVYRRIFGADPQNPVGFAWDRNGVPEQAEMERRAIKAITEGASGYEQVFHVPRPAGDIWLNETVTIVPTGPDTWDLVGIVTDISARHAAEQAWQDSQARLGKLLEVADCMVWEAAVTLRPDDSLAWDQYIPHSALYQRLFGGLAAGPHQLRWDELQLPEYPEMVQRTLRALQTKAPGYSQEFHVIQPTGDLWLREVVTIVVQADDRFRMVGVITDITAQRRAEEAQQRSELRLSALLDRADCMIWHGEARRVGTDDIHWKVFTPNSQLYRRLFGRDPEGECHFPWDNGQVPEQPQMKARAWAALTGGHTGYDQQFHYRLPEGDVWLNEQVTIKPLGADHWELVGVITDISIQHKAVLAQQKSEARLLDILTRAECLLWEATVTHVGEDWIWQINVHPSRLGQKLYGSAGLAYGEGLWRKFNVPEWSQMQLASQAAMREQRPGYEQLFHIIKPDGTVIWISENVTILPLGPARYSLVGVALDISAQRGAETALAAEKERLAVTLRAMKECVITTDVTGTVQFMNPAAAALITWPAEEACGRPVASLFRLQSARTEEPLEVPVTRVVQGDVIVDLPPHIRLVTRADGRRLIEGCCAPIHAADSKVIGTVLVFRDVTEQERLEQELVRATRLESVGVLAGGIAHDFNNILTAIMGNLALAQLDVTPDNPAVTSLRSAEKAALRARDLTQQLLTFAKGGEPVRAAVQLDAIVREMTTFALHGSTVRARFDMAPDLWPADADKGQIGRVVQNLVINSVQAMPLGGTLQISVRNDPQDGMSQPGLAAGDYIQIAITDTGEGIKPEHVARIFDPYFTTKQTGTGLGLAAVYSIVKKHRGHIEVDSQPGQGTTFRIWLPALRDESARMDTHSPWGTGQANPLRGRVLFMDDEPSIRLMAVALLERFGLTVECAVDGAEAVEKYRAAFTAGARYDLVIMDLTVPGGMGGLAALGRLREIDPAVRAVVSSGYSSDPVMANFRAHGFAGMVAKPYETAELARVLREVLPAD